MTAGLIPLSSTDGLDEGSLYNILSGVVHVRG
jgi:hypothetical protein